MGSILYDFLGESVLFDDARIALAYRGLTDAEIAAELERYRQFCTANIGQLQQEAASVTGGPRLVAAHELTPVSLLVRGSLYLDRFVVDDPLFRHTRNEVDPNWALLAGAKREDLRRDAILDAVAYLKEIAPFVAHDYVRVVPFSLFYEPPKQLPLRYSETQFAELLPKELLDFFRDRVKLREVKAVDGRLLVLPELKGPCRRISVSFEGSDSGSYFYTLQETRATNVDRKTGRFSMQMRIPDEPPSRASFDVWIEQSINAAAHGFFERATKGMGLAGSLDAMYLASTPLAAEIADFVLPPANGIPAFSASQALALDLPWLENAAPGTLMEIRSSDGEAFSLFRGAFDAKFRELRTVKDPNEIKIKVENAIHELTETQVGLLEAKMKTLQKKALAESTLVALGLAGAVQTAGWSVLASAIAAAQGLKTYSDYRAAVKDNPAYYLLSLKRKLGS